MTCRITWYSSTIPLPPCMSRDTRAMSSALPQLLRLTRLIISGATLPSSNSRPTRKEALRPSAISVCMSASFFWMSCVLASGRPNIFRSSV